MSLRNMSRLLTSLVMAMVTLAFLDSPHTDAATSPAKLIPVVVSKNVDGDTIHVRMPNGQDETIRMLLIDTPESVDPRKPIEPFGIAASHYAKHVLPVGKHIEIEEGVPGHQRDKYGRLLAFVYLSPTDMYNEDVVELGLARVAYIYPPNTQHLKQLESDESNAKAHHRDIWSIPGYVTQTGFNVGAKKSRPTSGSATRQSTTHTTGSPGVSSLVIVAADLNVTRNEYASVSVRTKPGANGTIEVDYKSGASHAQGLGGKKADSRGIITWSWDIGPRTSFGSWPVMIRANGKTVRTYVVVR